MDQIDNALTFFRLSAGSWRSQRTSHHLLHRRAEAGGSLIEVAMLSPDDPRLVAMANLHNQNPGEVVGGCHVRWGGSMAWDKHGEAHEGESRNRSRGRKFSPRPRGEPLANNQLRNHGKRRTLLVCEPQYPPAQQHRGGLIQHSIPMYRNQA